MKTKALLFAVALVSAALAQTPPWLPDLGDHRYKNPVLFFDYSDPDAIRVGDRFYLTASSFCNVPGLPILESHDLVNWRLIAYALPRLIPEDRYSVPRHGEGVWAPSLRYHANKYYIYYPDPDYGIYVITADEIDGPYTNPVLVEAGKGLIDPCPLWDDDGKVYLVHGWAKSRGVVANRLTVEGLSADGMKVIAPGRTVVDGAAMPGWTTIEGPKFYKRNGEYWIFAPAGGVVGGYQAVFRSRSVYGPYESRIVMDQGKTPINGPHQGAWVETEGGESWFLHFQDRGAFGRVVLLEPMQWRTDGWPVIGSDPTNSGKGEPVLEHASPAVKDPEEPCAPLSSDRFDDIPGPMWQWEANPGLDWSLGGSGAHGLLLKAVALKGPNLSTAGNLFLQKFPGPAFTATTKLAFGRTKNNEEAGLIVYGRSYSWIGLRRSDQGVQLVRATCMNAPAGGPETTLLADAPEEVTLRVTVSAAGACSFQWSRDGHQFEALGEPFNAEAGRWVGAKVGLFAGSVDGVERGKDANFGWFRVGPVLP